MSGIEVVRVDLEIHEEMEREMMKSLHFGNYQPVIFTGLLCRKFANKTAFAKNMNNNLRVISCANMANTINMKQSGYRSGSQLSKLLNNTYTLHYVSYTYYFILGLELGVDIYIKCTRVLGPSGLCLSVECIVQA